MSSNRDVHHGGHRLLPTAPPSVQMENSACQMAPPPYSALFDSNSSSSACAGSCSYACRLSVFLIFYSALILASGIFCETYLHIVCSYASPIWTATVSLVTAVVAIAAEVTKNNRVLVAHLLLSLLSIAAFTACGMISWRDYEQMGTPDWYTKNRLFFEHHLFCLLPEYNYQRLEYLTKLNYVDYGKCVWLLKIGAAILPMLVLGSVFGVILHIYAMFYSCKAYKRWPKL